MTGLGTSYEGSYGVMLKQGLVHFELMLRPSWALAASCFVVSNGALDRRSL